jgi:hypothetical protein
LTSGRRQTYAALVATVAAANSLPAGFAAVSDATARFESWYADALDGPRRGVDTVLDELGDARAGGFAALSEPRRLRLLREWQLAAAVDAVPNATAVARRHGLIASEALALASPPYGASEHRPTPLSV